MSAEVSPRGASPPREQVPVCPRSDLHPVFKSSPPAGGPLTGPDRRGNHMLPFCRCGSWERPAGSSLVQSLLPQPPPLTAPHRMPPTSPGPTYNRLQLISPDRAGLAPPGLQDISEATTPPAPIPSHRLCPVTPSPLRSNTGDSLNEKRGPRPFSQVSLRATHGKLLPRTYLT